MKAVLFPPSQPKDSQLALSLCQDMMPKLQAILSTLLEQKQILELKCQQQKNNMHKQFQAKEGTIRQLQQENAMLKQQIRVVGQQRDQKRSLIDFFKKKAAQQRAEVQGLNSIIRYLQTKNQELNQQLFQLRKARTARPMETMLKKAQNLKIPTQMAKNSDSMKRNPRATTNFLPPQFLVQAIQKDSLYQYTQLMDKDPLIQYCRTQSFPYRTESFPISQQLLKQTQDAITTVQRNSPKKQDTLRSKKFQISADSSHQMIKASKSKRGNMQKSQVTLLRGGKKTGKTRETRMMMHKSQTNLIKYLKE